MRKLRNRVLTAAENRGIPAREGEEEVKTDDDHIFKPGESPDSPNEWTPVSAQLDMWAPPWEYRTFIDRRGLRLISFRAGRADANRRVAELEKLLDGLVDELNNEVDDDGPAD